MIRTAYGGVRACVALCFELDSFRLCSGWKPCVLNLIRCDHSIEQYRAIRVERSNNCAFIEKMTENLFCAVRSGECQMCEPAIVELAHWEIFSPKLRYQRTDSDSHGGVEGKLIVAKQIFV